MPHDSYGKKMGNPHDDKADRRKDIENASDKPKYCPTCGQKISASTQGGGGVGGAAGGGGG